MLHRGSWCEHKEINDHFLTEGHDINIRESMTISSQRVLMYKRRTWIFLLKCRQTPRECLIFVRLTQKNVIVDFFFFQISLFFFGNDFQWFCGVWLITWCDDAWHVMIFFLKLYHMLTWMRGSMSGLFFSFIIFPLF